MNPHSRRRHSHIFSHSPLVMPYRNGQSKNIADAGLPKLQAAAVRVIRETRPNGDGVRRPPSKESIREMKRALRAQEIGDSTTGDPPAGDARYSSYAQLQKRSKELEAETRRLRRRIDAITTALTEAQSRAADLPEDASGFDEGIAEGISFTVARILTTLDEEQQNATLTGMDVRGGQDG